MRVDQLHAAQRYYVKRYWRPENPVLYNLRTRMIMRNVIIARIKLMVAKRYQVSRAELLSAARRWHCVALMPPGLSCYLAYGISVTWLCWWHVTRKSSRGETNGVTTVAFGHFKRRPVIVYPATNKRLWNPQKYLEFTSTFAIRTWSKVLYTNSKREHSNVFELARRKCSDNLQFFE